MDLRMIRAPARNGKGAAVPTALHGDHPHEEDRMDVVTLVERARAGDVEAFTELVRCHQRLALGSALACVRDADLARDVVQDAFVAAWRGLGRRADAKAFPAWLRGIVRRHAFHALRARPLETLSEAEHVAGDAASADQRID